MWCNHSKAIKEKFNYDETSDVVITVEKTSVKCICPKCRITHVLKFLWTGNGTPRKYCHRCREAVAGINEQCIYEPTPDNFRVHRHRGVVSLTD